MKSNDTKVESVYITQPSTHHINSEMSGRQLCRNYQQTGTCRYGNNCKFVHSNNNNNNSWNNNNWSNNNNNYQNNRNNNTNNNYQNNRNNNYNNTNVQKKPNQETPQEFSSGSTLKAKSDQISRDMSEMMSDMNNGAMLFTAYSLKPPANINLITGRDMSFEEIRLQYYNAKLTNSLPQFENQYKNRTNDMKQNCLKLKNESTKAARFLQLAVQNGSNSISRNFIDDLGNLDVPAAVGVGGVAGNGGGFNNNGISTGSSSIFGAQNATSNPFQQNSSPFGKSLSNTGAFGNQAGGAGAGAFSSQGGNANPFGSQTTTAGAFGSQTNTNTNTTGTGLFGKTSTSLWITSNCQ
ncbi:unnamed protein product [Ambrosiozyma monospora]|uniref:Unnamed protein product n=1 Tax=Ambrosiozyma monospora TaxID=43982 RepID=A0A9W7DG84_AMBMO|nr:unnamed protein product [Ambrosiozyma monospora]